MSDGQTCARASQLNVSQFPFLKNIIDVANDAPACRLRVLLQSLEVFRRAWSLVAFIVAAVLLPTVPASKPSIMGPRTSPTSVHHLPLAWSTSKDEKSWKEKRSILKLNKQTLLRTLSKHRLKLYLLLASLIQFLLLLIAYRSHRYHATVNLNRLTLSRGDPPKNAWWQGQNLTIWTIWIGDDLTPPPVIQAAMQSCRDIHKNEPNLQYRVVTNEDLHNNALGFRLHPSFWLLDNVEKSDYLRAELLHYHGGFYMDADMLCLQSFSGVLKNNLAAGAAQDRTKYGPWPSVSQNAFGPFLADSEITRAWHEGLMKTMDDISPQLQDCANEYAPNEIPYPTSRGWGTSLCGVEWGGVIDFVKPVWLEFYEKKKLGHDLSMCNIYGKHLGWDDYPDNTKCDIIHLGTAGDFYKKKEWNMEKLCQELPALHGSQHCRR